MSGERGKCPERNYLLWNMSGTETSGENMLRWEVSGGNIRGMYQ